MQKGPRRFGNSAQKYQSKLGRRFLEEHHKPPSNTGIPPQKSEPKIELVTKSRLFVARGDLLAPCAKLLSSAVETRSLSIANMTAHGSLKSPACWCVSIRLPDSSQIRITAQSNGLRYGKVARAALGKPRR